MSKICVTGTAGKCEYTTKLPKKFDLRKKNNFLVISLVVFVPRTQTYATELNEYMCVWYSLCC
jgi:hypothetical protein